MESDTNSDSSSAPSPSSPASPAASFHNSPPTLERLIQHYVSAKRSLSATNYVWRANELVTTSRTLIEQIAVLNARNTHTSWGVDEQVDTLHGIKENISVAGEDAGDQFRETIEKLDQANGRLERTLAALRKTSVNTSLQNATAGSLVKDQRNFDGNSSQPEASAEEQTLYDFIDSTKHQSLQSSLRHDIDTFNDSHIHFNTTISMFSDSLKTIADLLSDRPSDPVEKLTLYDEPPPAISALFHGMEDHAAEMANLLGGLVRHYDLCVNALKHTEGGGEAAKRAIQQAGGLSRNDEAGGGMEESLYLKAAPEPISEEERDEMLKVLENDAQEVDDVVSELQGRNREQEGLFEQLSQHARKARTRDATLREVLEMLHEMKDLHLPSHLHALQTFQEEWRRIQDSIVSKTQALLSLAASNESFWSAYTHLLREVDRRQAAEMQMRRVAEKTNKELRKLFEADREARKDFMDEFGPFLPQGIWGGVVEEGVLWQVREVASL